MFLINLIRNWFEKRYVSYADLSHLSNKDKDRFLELTRRFIGARDSKTAVDVWNEKATVEQYIIRK